MIYIGADWYCMCSVRFWQRQKKNVAFGDERGRPDKRWGCVVASRNEGGVKRGGCEKAGGRQVVVQSVAVEEPPPGTEVHVQNEGKSSARGRWAIL